MRGSRRARSRVASILTLAATAVCAACGAGHAEFELLLLGGTLVDGSGSSPVRGDLAIADGRIAALGSLGDRTADRIVDLSGLVVAPGFIDMHSHADLILLADGERQQALLAAKISQGVTTLIVGNCGLGTVPSNAEAATMLAAVNGWMTPDGVTAQPNTVAGYLDAIAAAGVALNVGTLVPHGPVRISTMGLAAGRPTPAELRAMRAAVERALGDGAFGLSAGLIYPPGMFSDTDELIELARAVAARDRLLTVHVRGSSETLLPATRELIEIGRRSEARVHHSHFEAVGERFWPDIEQALALEDDARTAGVAISHDVFPYTRAATMMAAIFPPWSLEGGVAALLERLADPETRRRIEREIRNHVPEWPPWRAGGWPHNLVEAVGWDAIRIASVPFDRGTDLVGRSAAELAEARSQAPFDLVADLMRDHDGLVGQLVGEISGDDDALGPLLTILRHPAAAIVSDAEDYGRGAPHPAHAGAFARALRLSREEAVLPLQEVVRRMTAYPASLLQLDDRGTLRVGAHADVVVFDPVQVADRASWSEPRRSADGVRFVLINGTTVVEDGVYRGGLAGHVLRASEGSPPL